MYRANTTVHYMLHTAHRTREAEWEAILLYLSSVNMLQRTYSYSRKHVLYQSSLVGVTHTGIRRIFYICTVRYTNIVYFSVNGHRYQQSVSLPCMKNVYVPCSTAYATYTSPSTTRATQYAIC